MVTRLVTWAKVFALAVGVPAAICLAIFGLLGYNNLQDAKRLTTEATEKIRPVVTDVLARVREAETSSHDTLARAAQAQESVKTVEAAIQDQTTRVARETEQLNTQLLHLGGAKNQLATLATQLQERAKENSRLERTVRELTKRVEVSEVAKIFPDLGSRPVATINSQVLGPKSVNAVWLNLQLSRRAERETRLTSTQIRDIKGALQREGFTVFLGFPAVTRNRGNEMAIQPGGSDERTQVLYFKPEGAIAAQRLKRVIERWVPVQSSMVQFVSPATLHEPTQEFLRLSDLDLLLVIGTR